MATSSRSSAAIDQILLVTVPFALWLLLSNRLGLGVLAARLPEGAGLLLHVAATAVVAVVLMAVALAREPNRRSVLGLGPMRPGAAFGWGLVGVVGSYAADSLAATAYLVITQRHLQDELANKAQWTSRLEVIPIAWIVPLALFVGVYEEVLFRGFLLGRLRVALLGRGLSPRVAIAVAVLVSSLLFSAGHAYQGPLGVVQTFAMGVVLALVAVRSGAIWPCILAHGIIDSLGLFVLRGLSLMLGRPP